MTMDTDHGPVVVGIDGSEGSDMAVDWAAAEARVRGGTLRLICAVGDYGEGTMSMYQVPMPAGTRVLEAGRRMLDAAIARARDLDATLPITGEIVEQPPGPALLAESGSAAVVVIGSRGLGALGSAVLGSVGAAVAARASSPVVVVRGPAGRPEEHAAVVVGVDAEDTTPEVLSFAFEYASRHDLPLRVVLCWRRDLLAEMAWRPEPPPPPHAERWLAESLAGWRERYPDVPARGEIIRGQAAAELVQASHAQNLLVVGTRGRRALARTLLGSVSQGVLHHATCPVAVVPLAQAE